MVVKDFNFQLKEKEQKIKVKECKTLYSKFKGLMFKKDSLPLLFIFKKPVKISIHSFFCKPFIAIWFLQDKIIEIKSIKSNKPSIKPRKEFDKLLEIPSNSDEYSTLLSSLSTEQKDLNTSLI